MAKIITTGLCVPIILGLCLLLYVVIWSDISSAREYKNAARCTGRVRRQLEKVSVNVYGSGLIGMRRRRYFQYEVDFVVDGGMRSGVLQTRDKLQPGAITEIRYIICADIGLPHVVNRMYSDRLMELLIGFVGGLIMAAVIIVLKAKEEY